MFGADASEFNQTTNYPALGTFHPYNDVTKNCDLNIEYKYGDTIPIQQLPDSRTQDELGFFILVSFYFFVCVVFEI